jgi:enterochelin esterase-like enzyme
VLPATITPSPTVLGCWKQGGKIEISSLPSKILPPSLDFRIYSPPCYDQQASRRYPVLYLFHGQRFNDDQWDRLGVGEVMDRLVAAGEIAPFIIVMPRDRYDGIPDEDHFPQAIVEELVPYIDNAYRTQADRFHRAVGGLSRGGGWAIHLGISNWELFGALGAHSPGIFFRDAQYMRKWLDTIPTSSFPRIYIDIGDRDSPEMLSATNWFEKLLNDRDIPHDWYLFSGAHAESYWASHVEQYLRWYAQDWTAEGVFQ